MLWLWLLCPNCQLTCYFQVRIPCISSDDHSIDYCYQYTDNNQTLHTVFLIVIINQFLWWCLSHLKLLAHPLSESLLVVYYQCVSCTNNSFKWPLSLHADYMFDKFLYINKGLTLIKCLKYHWFALTGSRSWWGSTYLTAWWPGVCETPSWARRFWQSFLVTHI